MNQWIFKFDSLVYLVFVVLSKRQMTTSEWSATDTQIFRVMETLFDHSDLKSITGYGYLESIDARVGV